MFAATAANGAAARSWAEEHAVEECQDLPKAVCFDAATVRGLKRAHQVDAKSGNLRNMFRRDVLESGAR